MLNSQDTSPQSAAASERRASFDRRGSSTRFVSRYWLVGRRKGGRRDDEARNIYVDRYSTAEWVMVVGILVLSVLDMVFTVLHLNAGGTEANPVMAWALEWGGQRAFEIVKLASTFLGLFVLLVHIRFRRVKTLLTFAFAVYASVFVFHLYLIWLRSAAEYVS